MAGQRWMDISLLGDRALETAFNVLPELLEKKIARKATRETAKSMRPKLARAAPRDTGTLQAEMAKAPVRSQSGKRHVIRIVVLMPTREALGIPQDTLARKYGYYPLVLEYGSISRGILPLMWLRLTTDRETPSEHARMRRIINQGVALAFNKLTWHGNMMGVAA